MKNAFLIGDVAKILGISTETIRFYEKEGLVVPRKHEKTSYRYYSTGDVTQLVDILFFRDLSLSIKDIKEIVNTKERTDMRQFFLEKQEEVEKNIHNQTLLLHRLRAIEDALQTVEHSLGIYEIRPYPSFYILADYNPESLLLNANSLGLDINQLYHLCLVGGEIKPNAKQDWELAQRYLYIDRRTAIDHGVVDNFENKQLVNSKRSVHTVVQLPTADSLLKEVTHLLAWMDMNGTEPAGNIRYNYLANNILTHHTANCAELWAPIA